MGRGWCAGHRTGVCNPKGGLQFWPAHVWGASQDMGSSVVILGKVEQCLMEFWDHCLLEAPPHEAKSETAPQGPHRQTLLLRPGRGWPLRCPGVPAGLVPPSHFQTLPPSPAQRAGILVPVVGWLAWPLPAPG